MGAPDGHPGDVVIYNADCTGQYTVTAPYGADFSGGVRVALADVTGDGVEEVKVGAASRVTFDGASLAQGQQVQLLGTVLGIGDGKPVAGVAGRRPDHAHQEVMGRGGSGRWLRTW